MNTHKVIVVLHIKKRNSLSRAIEFLLSIGAIEITPTSYYIEFPREVSQLWGKVAGFINYRTDTFYICSLKYPCVGWGAPDFQDKVKGGRLVKKMSRPTDARG